MKIILMLLVMIAWFIISSKPVLSKDDYTFIQSYPSDSNAFTQGLEFSQDQLIMGTGLYGESRIGYLDMETGKLKTIDKLHASLFGEGITVSPYGVWQLTWKAGIAYLRNSDTLDIEDTFTYSGEGWGIAYDEDLDTLWMSNGSDKIYQRSPQTFEILREFSVIYDGKPVKNLNELEYHNGKLYVNIWKTNQIIVIDLLSQEIVQSYDFTDLIYDQFTAEERREMDTLNGIAHIEGQRFIITGKLYPKLLEVELPID